ncbi:MAG: hypothetical protein R6V04_09100 [bacterium]
MNLVSISFEIDKDKQSWVFKDIQKMLDSFQELGYSVSLYRDKLNENSFLLNYHSDKPEEHLVDLLQNDSAVKSFFQKLKDVSKKVEISSHKKLF